MDTAAAERLGAGLQALFESCDDRERKLVSEADWASAREAPGNLEVRFAEARVLDTRTQSGVRVTHLLLPAGDTPGTWRTQVLARDGATLYSAFSMPDGALHRQVTAELVALTRPER